MPRIFLTASLTISFCFDTEKNRNTKTMSVNKMRKQSRKCHDIVNILVIIHFRSFGEITVCHNDSSICAKCVS